MQLTKGTISARKKSWPVIAIEETSASKGRSRSVRPQQATTEDKRPQQKIEGHDRR
ncbi:hypothetical protein HPP92_003373 [Vanilla planifolia]|uniref:Uncharacterized protein n=1 Tax=Vanilla planifolia TaxID=51239 RepID=A0A835VH53_VANPL|nr:hypothetical protein HPP92_003373 [Vanilla planifolia]